jgi:lysophospholipid acyltransferase (LPLAT)-like uncharacterized protein
MKIRDPRLIRTLGWLVALFLRIWRLTVRLRIEPGGKARHLDDPTRPRGIYVFWHETLLGMVALRMPANVMISKHADGELIAQACRHLGIGTVRGSTTRGGGLALVEMARRAKAEVTDLAITPDGPRGPRRRMQPGVVSLASHAGWSVVPIGIGFTWAWRARSWDRFAVPLPFSRVTYIAAEPIEVPDGLDRDGLEEYRLRIEQSALAVSAEAEQWAAELAQERRTQRGPHVRPVGPRTPNRKTSGA